MPTLLVVDDDPSWRSLYRLEFERRWKVIEAEDGLEGLRLVTTACPDLIILDLQMPRMNGLAFLKALRRRGVSVPVIVCTAVLPPSGPPPFPGVKIVEKSPSLADLHSAVDGALPTPKARPLDLPNS